MGTGLVGKVYGGVIRRYEGKGPLDVDAEIEGRETRRSRSVRVTGGGRFQRAKARQA